MTVQKWVRNPLRVAERALKHLDDAKMKTLTERLDDDKLDKLTSAAKSESQRRGRP